MNQAEVEGELERTASLATLTRDEIKTIRTRLEATRAAAQRLEKLDYPACQQAQAGLPPVQP